MTVLVEAKDVRKSFETLAVLKGVSFRLDKGETLVVMGGSGSGKTVLLRIIDGLLRPDGGAVMLFDQHIERLSEEAMLPVRRRLGYVFQGAALFDSLTVEENVAFPLREHTDLSAREIHERVIHFLSLVGLDEKVLPSSRPSSRAGCASASGSPARSSVSRTCCCSTSRRPGSIRRTRSWSAS